MASVRTLLSRNQLKVHACTWCTSMYMSSCNKHYACIQPH